MRDRVSHPPTRRGAQTLTLPARYAKADSVTTAIKPAIKGSALKARSAFERNLYVRFCHTFGTFASSASHGSVPTSQMLLGTPDDM